MQHTCILFLLLLLPLLLLLTVVDPLFQLTGAVSGRHQQLGVNSYGRQIHRSDESGCCDVRHQVGTSERHRFQGPLAA